MRVFHRLSPLPSSRVVDLTSTLPPETRQEIDRLGDAVKARTGNVPPGTSPPDSSTPGGSASGGRTTASGSGSGFGGGRSSGRGASGSW